MRRVLSVVVLLLILINASAQETTHNSIQLSWGIGNIMRQDLTVSRLIHKDWSPVNVRLSYQRSKKLEHDLTLRFGFYSPGPTENYPFVSFYGGATNTIPHSFKLLHLDYSAGRKCLQKENWFVVAGGKSRNYIYASDYYFGLSGPSPMMISFGLDVYGQLQYTLNDRNYLKTDLSLPVFSFVYRNPYLTEDDEYHQILYSGGGFKEFTGRIAHSKLRSWGNAQRMELNVRYGHVVNNRWDLGLCYHFSMNTNQQPAKFTQFENVFFLEGKLKFH